MTRFPVDLLGSVHGAGRSLPRKPALWLPTRRLESGSLTLSIDPLHGTPSGGTQSHRFPQLVLSLDHVKTRPEARKRVRSLTIDLASLPATLRVRGRQSPLARLSAGWPLTRLRRVKGWRLRLWHGSRLAVLRRSQTALAFRGVPATCTAGTVRTARGPGCGPWIRSARHRRRGARGRSGRR